MSPPNVLIGGLLQNNKDIDGKIIEIRNIPCCLLCKPELELRYDIL